MRCRCQDSKGAVCNKRMATKERKQDGMCQACADNVWVELTTGKEFTHKGKKDEQLRNPSS